MTPEALTVQRKLEDFRHDHDSSAKGTVVTATNNLSLPGILKYVEPKYKSTTRPRLDKKKTIEKKEKKETRPDSPKVGPGGYNPKKPLISGVSMSESITKMNALNARPVERDATPACNYNPHLVQHMVAGAPYTHAMCNKCRRNRKCRTHRKARQERTSVSLCAHSYMSLFWAIDDPVNENSSWKLEIKDYYLDTDRDRKDHEKCKPFSAGERIKILAERLVEDFRDPRITASLAVKNVGGVVRGVDRLRGCTRRAEKEICALVGALEAAEVRRVVIEEKKKDMRENLAKKLKLVKRLQAEKRMRVLEKNKSELAVAGIEREQMKKKRKFSEAEHGEVAERVELDVVVKKIRKGCSLTSSVSEREASPTLRTKPCTTSERNTNSSTPGSQHTSIQRPLTTSVIKSLIRSHPASQSNKRKRSSDSEHRNSNFSKAKRVRFTSELEVASIVEKP